MSTIKFIVELTPPLNPANIPTYYNKFSHLLRFTKSFGIVSHAVGQVDGFDRAYNMANYLLDKHPSLDLLFHLTCRDLNLVNATTRLELLRKLKIRKLLLISGQHYQPSEKASAVCFADSTRMASYIAENYAHWFDSIAIAGYPSDLVEKECKRLSDKLDRITASNTIYTQCIFNEPEQFIHLRQLMMLYNEALNIVPGIAIFSDIESLEKALRLTTGDHSVNPLPQLNLLSGEKAKLYSLNHLRDLCLQLTEREEHKSLYLCSFNQFELVEDLIEEILRLETMSR